MNNSNNQSNEAKDVVRVISTIAFVATYILYSLDCNGWGSGCLLLTIITSIYSDGWRATLFVCAIFATLIMSVYISMQFHIELSECGKMPQLLYNQTVIFANMKL